MPQRSKSKAKTDKKQIGVQSQTAVIAYVEKIVSGEHHTNDLILVKDFVRKGRAEDLLLTRNSMLRCAAEYGHLPIVRWLLLEQDADVFTRDAQGNNILHLAVSNHHRPLVQWLLHSDELKTYKLRHQLVVNEGKARWIMESNNDGETALSLAIRLKNERIVWGFLREASILPWNNSAFVSHFKTLVQDDAVSTHLQPILVAALREHDVKMVWDLYCGTQGGFRGVCDICSAPPSKCFQSGCQCFQSDCRDELESRFASCLWWPLSMQSELWNDAELHALCAAARVAAARGHMGVLTWLIEDWKVDIWSGGAGKGSVADCAATGVSSLGEEDEEGASQEEAEDREEFSRFMLECQELGPEKQRARILQLDVDKGDRWMKYLAEKKKEQRKDEENAVEREDPFFRLVAEQWSGDTPEELARLVQAAIDAEAAELRIAPSADSEKLTKELAILQEQNSSPRLQALSLLLARFGARAVPRLDLLLQHGATSALEFLTQRGLLDLSGPVVFEQSPPHPRPVTSLYTNTDSDDCAVCLDELWSPVSFPCRHRFCRTCVRQLHQTAAAGAGFVACPLCRGTVPEEYCTDSVQHLVDTLPTLAPTLFACLCASRLRNNSTPTISVGHVLGGICAELGLLAPLCWLASAMGFGNEGLGGMVATLGCNVIHIAAKHGHLHLVKWGCQPGRKDLAGALSAAEPGSEGGGRDAALWRETDRAACAGVLPEVLPVHEALRMGHKAVFELLHAQGLASQDGQGREWTEYAELSGTPIFTDEVARFRGRCMLATTLPELVERGASVEEVAAVVEGATFLTDADCVQGQAERELLRAYLLSVVRKGRADLLRWLFTRFDCNVFRVITGAEGDPVVFVPSDGRRVVDEHRTELEKEGALPGLEEVLGELEGAVEQFRECKERQQDFRRHFVAGDEVEALKEMVSLQQEAVAKVDPAFSRWFEFFTYQLDVGGGLMPNPNPPHELVAPLQVAIERGHVHLVEWLIAKPEPYNNSYLEGFIKRMIGRRGQTMCFHMALEVLVRRSSVELGKYLESLMQDSLLQYLLPETPDETDTEQVGPTDPNVCTREQVFHDLEWMLSRPYLNPEAYRLLNVVSGSLSMYFLTGQHSLFYEEGEDLFVAAIRLLAASRNRVQWLPTNASAQHMISIVGMFGATKMVRVLALELCINMQSCHINTKGFVVTHYATFGKRKMEEWEEIKEEQGRMFDAVDLLLCDGGCKRQGAGGRENREQSEGKRDSCCSEGDNAASYTATLRGFKVGTLKDRHGRGLLQVAKERGREAVVRRVMREVLAPLAVGKAASTANVAASHCQ